MLEEIFQEIDELNKKVVSFIPAVKEDVLQKKVDEIEKQSINDKDFWSKKESKHLLKEQSSIKKFLESFRELLQLQEDINVLKEHPPYHCMLWQCFWQAGDESSLLLFFCCCFLMHGG